MKRIIFSILTLTLNLSLFAQDWQALEKTNYSIKYPTNWELNESGMMGISFALFSPQESSGDLFRENVNLIEQDLTGMNMDLDKYTEISTSQIKTMIANANIISNERFGDHQKVIYEGDQGPFQLTFEQYYWIANDKAYILTFTAERTQFSKYQKTGEQILNSFKLK